VKFDTALLCVIVLLEVLDFWAAMKVARQESETRGVMLEILVQLTTKGDEKREYIKN